MYWGSTKAFWGNIVVLTEKDQGGRGEFVCVEGCGGVFLRQIVLRY